MSTTTDALTTSTGNYGILIGREVIAGTGGEITLRSRVDGSTFGQLDSASPADVSRAYEVAAAAQGAWGSASPSARAAVLQRAAELFRDRAGDIGQVISAEMGKPAGEARTEVEKGAAILEYYAQAGFRSLGDTYVTDTGEDVFTVVEPLGVVALITPWNFPFTIPIRKVAAALAAGNAAVLKPASNSAVCGLAIGQALLDAGLPAGVLNVVVGPSSELAEVLLTHPVLAGVSMTGSYASAQAMHARLAVEIPFQAELGGKNALVIWNDVDLDHAIEVIAQSSFRNNGQICTSAGRVLVHRDVAEPLLERLRAALAARPVDGAEGRYGTMSSEREHQGILDTLERNRDGVAEILRAPWPEDLMAPTVLLAPSARELTEEEIFGPVITFEVVDSMTAAIEAANATAYGLTAGIVTNDLAAAQTFWRASTAGTVKVNAPLTGTPYHVPLQGFGHSGAGAGEGGTVSLDFFVRRKAVHVRRTPRA